MKRNILLSGITGLILMISFQNCSQGTFQASSEAQIAQSTKVIASDDQIQDWLDKDQAYACPAIRCSLPPEGYHYEPDNSVDSICPVSCGRLVANSGGIRVPTHPVICPAILCSAVPEGCHRVAAANTVKDVNGCNLSCGEVVCEDKSTGKAEVGDSGTDVKVDENSKQLFGAVNQARIRCPAIRCANAPVNCFYRQVSSEKNACPTCGELICKKPPFTTDMPPVPTE